MTDDDVQRWLDDYREAWLSYDGTAIAALFSEDALYRYHPWDEPVRGRDAIVSDWVAPDGNASTRDEPDSWDARYEPYALEGECAVAVGWSRYVAQGEQPERTYRNCYLLEFEPDGRCRSFIEYYVLEK